MLFPKSLLNQLVYIIDTKRFRDIRYVWASRKSITAESTNETIIIQVDCRDAGEDDSYDSGHRGSTTSYQVFIMRFCTMKELNWWMTQSQAKNGLMITTRTNSVMKEPAVMIHVDALDSGWGVTSSMVETAGYWTDEEKEMSINVRELKMILFALQLHAQKYKNCIIQIFSDNTTALKYAKKYVARVVGTNDDRHICLPSKYTTKRFLELPAGSRRSSDQCISTTLAENRTLLTPPMAVDPTSDTEIERRSSEDISDDNTRLVKPVLVADDSTTNCVNINTNTTAQFVEFDRMAIIREYQVRQEINEKVATYIRGANRSSTHKSYDNLWMKWVR
ncbi:hypothetical protein PHYBLDRAFT_72725 [Phycomyces blakesleeanus NRRL 1555(-)]|uniref:RNase H type-1 domain-containing protein n=1 Tax=Phycomyces blakesleeanus (strain ATCC 8743b / DSM 1359 / FGSC 10004 / NBRC 33097 / NRRL 1555) TaxID=763407 RepID=A0A163A8L5_PHYB8|nr:hypothetical protein PHYBLDRAFT_72725 [Phycomyces blakesleeanus NRRL 1555(-)]OAD71791.1 hypothetical protein PHYBLDRAFT_72725 [Phycomyces blakesleeanus NRRL 1555(-)]|eukprot:XP_018289831.1 hypothetical protein PHYBLDRAFT_72725 [Phycomyces blakesleeanus NRRL 1555(-)]